MVILFVSETTARQIEQVSAFYLHVAVRVLSADRALAVEPQARHLRDPLALEVRDHAPRLERVRLPVAGGDGERHAAGDGDGGAGGVLDGEAAVLLADLDRVRVVRARVEHDRRLLARRLGNGGGDGLEWRGGGAGCAVGALLRVDDDGAGGRRVRRWLENVHLRRRRQPALLQL